MKFYWPCCSTYIFLNDFKIHCIKLWIFTVLGEWKAESELWPWSSVNAAILGWGQGQGQGCAPQDGNQNIVIWGQKIKSSRKPHIIFNREQLLFQALLLKNSDWSGVRSVRCWISFCIHSYLTKIFGSFQFQNQIKFF